MVPDSDQYWGGSSSPVHPVYWYITRKLGVVWRFNTGKPKDIAHKADGNYFHSERDAQNYIDTTLLNR